MTYSYDLDDCYHLVSSECYKNSYAVLAKNKDTEIELKEAASRYQSSRSPYEIWVDGERKEVKPDELLVFLSKDRQHKYSAEWSNNKIIVDTPAHRVQYNGRELSVE